MMAAMLAALLTALQPADNLVVNAMHGSGQVLVSELGCTVAKLFIHSETVLQLDDYINLAARR
jgi:hypothetical protein